MIRPIYECGGKQCPGTATPHHGGTCPGKRDNRICAAIEKRSEDYRIEAARKLLAAGLEHEGEFDDADTPIIPIPGEIPGAWVPVLVWVNASDLPPKRRT